MIVLAVLTVLFTYPTARSPNTLVGRSYVRWRRVAVRGPSMSPALHDGDVVLVRFGAAARPGDVVLVGWAARPGQLSVKRAVRPDGDGWWVHGRQPVRLDRLPPPRTGAGASPSSASASGRGPGRIRAATLTLRDGRAGPG